LAQRANAQFILNIPIRFTSRTALRAIGGATTGYGYTWQTPQFYAAMVQYLVGAAGPQSEWQNLPTTIDFFPNPPASTGRTCGRGAAT